MNRHDIHIHPCVEITRNVITVIDELEQCLNRPKEIKVNIHRIRVNIKRLRAWIRLVRNQSDEQEWQVIDQGLRDMAKQLSSGRDEQVITVTLKWLIEKTKNRDSKTSISRIDTHVQSDSCGHIFDWKTIKLLDKSLLEMLRRKTLLSYSDDIIRRGLRKTYKRTLTCGLQACSTKGTFADLHRLRRWVKYLYYQLEFIEVLYADDYRKIHRQLDKLGKGLGKIHDLILVKNRFQCLSEVEECANDVNIAGSAADAEINKLLKRSRRAFDKIFTLKPREFTAGLK